VEGDSDGQCVHGLNFLQMDPLLCSSTVHTSLTGVTKATVHK